mmetsp:Transcript_44659/g.123791  ORF Transcript_44659/g.123791 Transcript_44659/m.123791 type:complete len:558 (+) Transcript_44659:78-1751(+)
MAQTVASGSMEPSTANSAVSRVPPKSAAAFADINFERLRLPELRKLCDMLGLPSDGIKHLVLARLRALEPGHLPRVLPHWAFCAPSAEPQKRQPRLRARPPKRPGNAAIVLAAGGSQAAPAAEAAISVASDPTKSVAMAEEAIPDSVAALLLASPTSFSVGVQEPAADAVESQAAEAEDAEAEEAEAQAEANEAEADDDDTFDVVLEKMRAALLAGDLDDEDEHGLKVDEYEIIGQPATSSDVDIAEEAEGEMEVDTQVEDEAEQNQKVPDHVAAPASSATQAAAPSDGAALTDAETAPQDGVASQHPEQTDATPPGPGEAPSATTAELPSTDHSPAPSGFKGAPEPASTESPPAPSGSGGATETLSTDPPVAPSGSGGASKQRPARGAAASLPSVAAAAPPGVAASVPSVAAAAPPALLTPGATKSATSPAPLGQALTPQLKSAALPSELLDRCASLWQRAEEVFEQQTVVDHLLGRRDALTAQLRAVRLAVHQKSLERKRLEEKNELCAEEERQHRKKLRLKARAQFDSWLVTEVATKGGPTAGLAPRAPSEVLS